MVRLRRKFECSNCHKIYYKWQGFCSCGSGGTIKETTETTTPQAKASSENKRIRTRAKNTERTIARRMAGVDGEDQGFKNIASLNGRVGFINGMRIDAVSQGYVIEAKNRKLPTWMISAWILLQQRGRDFGKNILLYIEPPNLPHEIPSQGIKIKTESMAIITQTRHEELIQKEKELDAKG